MGTTEPIRNKKELELFREYYHKERPNERNYAMIVMGLHTALRISDILRLRWEDVRDFHTGRFRGHLQITEHKTGKRTSIALGRPVKSALGALFKEGSWQPSDYIFSKTTDHQTPLSRSQAYRIVKAAAEETLPSGHFSCHSLRKTFGYQAWKQGVPPALLMDIFNHSSYSITRRYLGITQDERDEIFLGIKL